MNSLILSLLVTVVVFFHCNMRSHMRKGKVKTGLCAIWCMDAIFAICGTVISFMLYRYVFHPFLSVRNLVLVLFYLLVTLFFVWQAPTGLALFGRKRGMDEAQLLLAEYRLNDTLGTVRSFFMLLLFLLPVLYSTVGRTEWFRRTVSWQEAEICGGFCFVAFLILIPISLRQALYWLRNLTDSPVEEEQRWLRNYVIRLNYRRKNRFL